MSSFLLSKYEFSTSTNFETLHIPATDFNKIKNHEISIEGEMYDIKEIKSTKLGYQLKVYKDTRESYLINFLSLAKKQKVEINILNLLALLSLNHEAIFDFKSIYIIIEKINFPYNLLYTNPLSSILAPPPEFS